MAPEVATETAPEKALSQFRKKSGHCRTRRSKKLLGLGHHHAHDKAPFLLRSTSLHIVTSVSLSFSSDTAKYTLADVKIRTNVRFYIVQMHMLIKLCNLTI